MACAGTSALSAALAAASAGAASLSGITGAAACAFPGSGPLSLRSCSVVFGHDELLVVFYMVLFEAADDIRESPGEVEIRKLSAASCCTKQKACRDYKCLRSLQFIVLCK